MKLASCWTAEAGRRLAAQEYMRFRSTVAIMHLTRSFELLD
jgi:hypothetical protein